jgi:hypothetical protein
MESKRRPNPNVAKKSFNLISSTLLEQLNEIFPGDIALITTRAALGVLIADTNTNHLPALKYFNTMNKKTNMKNAAGIVTVGELICRKDDVLFKKDIGVEIPELDAMKLKDKWAKLSEKEREIVWEYLIKMAKFSALTVLGSGEILNIVGEVLEGKRVVPGMSENDFVELAKHIKSQLTSE